MEPVLTYLDHAATTPVRAEVRDAMRPYFDDVFGNPSSSHRFGRAARAGLEQARREIAEAVGCEPTQVVFTSGGTEADNLAIIGAAFAASARGRPRCVAVSAIEHKAILAAAHTVATLGGEEIILPVHADGSLQLEALEAALRPQASSRVGHVGQQRGWHRPADGGDRGTMYGCGRATAHRRRAGVRKDCCRPPASPRFPAYPVGPQARCAQGHRRADHSRSRAGGVDHPWRGPAVRHPARHRECRRCSRPRLRGAPGGGGAGLRGAAPRSIARPAGGAAASGCSRTWSPSVQRAAGRRTS